MVAKRSTTCLTSHVAAKSRGRPPRAFGGLRSTPLPLAVANRSRSAITRVSSSGSCSRMPVHDADTQRRPLRVRGGVPGGVPLPFSSRSGLAAPTETEAGAGRLKIGERLLQVAMIRLGVVLRPAVRELRWRSESGSLVRSSTFILIVLLENTVAIRFPSRRKLPKKPPARPNLGKRLFGLEARGRGEIRWSRQGKTAVRGEERTPPEPARESMLRGRGPSAQGERDIARRGVSDPRCPGSYACARGRARTHADPRLPPGAPPVPSGASSPSPGLTSRPVTRRAAAESPVCARSAESPGRTPPEVGPAPRVQEP